MMEPIRISKFFTDCGVLSRRAADEAIRQGDVQVNGVTAVLGQKIRPEQDTVTWKGRPVRLPAHVDKMCILLNKPRGYVTTLSDEKGRPTVASLIRQAGVRLYPVGRLDMDSDGLLLMTNDGDLANGLTHPRQEIDKVYLAYVNGSPTTAQMTGLTRPIEIDGRMTAPAFVRKAGWDDQGTVIEVTIHDGRNREVRRLCEREGLVLRRLTRIAEGPIRLGNLDEGQWRRLTSEEMRRLKELF